MCHVTTGSEATVRAIELLACTTLSSTTLFMDVASFVPEVCYHPKPTRDQQKKVLEPICSPKMGDARYLMWSVLIFSWWHIAVLVGAFMVQQL